MDEEDVPKLIAAFKKHPVIYDPESPGYNARKAKAAAWKSIASEMNVHPEICRRKIASLLASCRREKHKILKGKTSNDPKDKYETKWRYWNLLKFYRGLRDDEEDPLGAAPEEVPPPKGASRWSTANLLAQKRKNSATNPTPSSRRCENADVQDESTAIGKMVDAKLAKMDPKQRAFAETIIDQILYKGLLFQLSVKSEIGDNESRRLDDSKEITQD